MRNTARHGNTAEVYVAKWLESEGFIVGSRRHTGGAGDLLAVRFVQSDVYEAAPGRHEIRLIEVKSRKNVWEGFRREDRLALMEAAHRIYAEPWMVNVVAGGIIWFGPASWPKT